MKVKKINLIQNNKLVKQIALFGAVGIVNTAVDLSILNLLIFLFGLGENLTLYTLYKAISFLGAVINSYFLNKYFVFSRDLTQELKNENQTFNENFNFKEKILFLMVSLVGFAINISVSIFIFRFTLSTFPEYSNIAVNVGAIYGTGAVLFWNFIGYKFLVYKNK